jgi:hypothetical protein
MSSKQAVPKTTIPSYQSPGDNQSGADIPPCRIMKRVLAGTTPNLVALATSNADIYAGVSTELMYNGRAQSYQDGGSPAVETGGVFNVGDRLTSDASGRAIKSTALTQSLLGCAETASSVLGDFAAVKLWREGNIA